MTRLGLTRYFQAMGFSAVLTVHSIIVRRSDEDITSRDIISIIDTEHWSIIDRIINARRMNDDSFDYVIVRLNHDS